MAGRRWCALPLPILFSDPKTFGKLPLGQLSWTPGGPLSSQQHWELEGCAEWKGVVGEGSRCSSFAVHSSARPFTKPLLFCCGEAAEHSLCLAALEAEGSGLV